MPNPPLKSPSLVRRLRMQVHEAQRSVGHLVKGPTSGMRTGLTAHGKPVLLIHNPRTGGRSLEELFHVKRLSHVFPVERLAERHWCKSYIVTSVRHPWTRFFSGYFGFVRAPGKNGLVKLYGWGVKSLTPLEYLDLIKKHPKHIGPQVQWTDFPSTTKPRADLVLKLEDVRDWESILRRGGVEIRDRTIPHVGKSGNMNDISPESVGLDARDFELLRRKVEDYYASDYLAFGYPREFP